MLGSDELYREWGYTALSRHRDAARFYVTATADFLNAAPEPLRDADVPRRVARMLDDSRAEHLALHGVSRDELRPLLLEQIERATANLADADAALEASPSSARRRAGTRAGAAPTSTAPSPTTAACEAVAAQVDRLTTELAEHPEPPEPALWRGRDPLARLDPAAELGRERSRQRG